MARYTTEQTIAFNSLRDSRSITDNGELQIRVWDTTEFILADTLTTGSCEYFTKGLRLKFTPVSGSYYIEEGESR